MRLDIDRKTKDQIMHACGFDENEQLGSVFELIWRGKSILEISRMLNISDSTVNRRIRDIKKRMTRFQ